MSFKHKQICMILKPELFEKLAERGRKLLFACIQDKQGFLGFDAIFCVKRLFMRPYFLKQQLINGRQKEKSTSLNFLVGLFTCVWRNVHLPLDEMKDRRRQMAFSLIFQTFHFVSLLLDIISPPRALAGKKKQNKVPTYKWTRP